ncbi:MAG: hypothetical protein C0506_03135 [Anaerolinea sp.]|nr:hypothetical protein [Anaerolinea sp.]
MSLEPEPPLPSLPRLRRQSIVEVVMRYGLELAGEPRPVAASVLNENYRVPTSAGERFVRFHRKTRPRERLELEAAVIAYAGDHGVPVFAPLADNQGRALHSVTNQFISVYPWIDGGHFERGAITAAQARVLGDMQGRIHVALRDFADSRLPSGKTGSDWDADEALDVLARVDDLIRYYPANTPEQLRLQDAVREQMEMLQSVDARPASDFGHLHRQCCHGDYHERNVIINAAGGVAAVVDWEIAGLLPPVFEVIRALSFMELWKPDLCGAYLAAYRSHLPLEDCAEGVEMWWQAQLHSTWAYRARFIEGNRAAAQFLEPHRRMLTALRDRDYRQMLLARLEAGA